MGGKEGADDWQTRVLFVPCVVVAQQIAARPPTCVLVLVVCCSVRKTLIPICSAQHHHRNHRVGSSDEHRSPQGVSLWGYSGRDSGRTCTLRKAFSFTGTEENECDCEGRTKVGGRAAMPAVMQAAAATAPAASNSQAVPFDGLHLSAR